MAAAGAAAPEFICANWGAEGADCKRIGTYSCKNCLLVIYCGPSCQKAHWPQHKSDCKSPLGKKSWLPAWALEMRAPSFFGGPPQNHFGAKKYLWGNVPALDILRLGANEGEGYVGDLRILFAASGDLRNVVKTIAQLPTSYSGSLEVTVNDRDFDIVGRNIILLLIALVVGEGNPDEAVDCMIHLWYSACVCKSNIDLLQGRIRPLIKHICDQTEGKKPGTLLAKTWTFGQTENHHRKKSLLRVVLKKEVWESLLSLIDGPPASFTAETARKIRTDITLAESRRDIRDRHMYYQSPSHRIAFNRFREDGILLPFGSSRREFREPNPTFFQGAATAWPMDDGADPLFGWSLEEVYNTSSGAATADLYGKIFFHVRGMLHSFLRRLSNLDVSFRLFHLDAASLPGHLEKNAFHRIEVSNISDAGYMGIDKTLDFVPLLQTPLENPHATLITLFMNAVDEFETDEEKKRDLTRNSPATRKLLKYFPSGVRPTSFFHPDGVKFFEGYDWVKTHDHIFDRYAFEKGFRLAPILWGAQVKENHTIIDKWPYRLKLQPGQPGAQEEFDRCMSGVSSGKERYVEWKRI